MLGFKRDEIDQTLLPLEFYFYPPAVILFEKSLKKRSLSAYATKISTYRFVALSLVLFFKHPRAFLRS